MDASGDFFESSAYIEQPFGQRYAAVVAPWYYQNNNPTTPQRGEATLALKAAVLRTSSAAMAVQGGLVWRSNPEDGCSEGGAELRWLGGFSLGEHKRSFVNLEAAARAQDGGCRQERIDLTLGHRAGPHWLAMAEVFSARQDDSNGLALLGQLSLVRFASERGGVQLGLRARLDDDIREPAIVFALWRAPHPATSSRPSDKR